MEQREIFIFYYNGFNETHLSDKCGYLNAFVPVGSVVCELLESLALLEKVCYLGQTLRFLALPSFQFAISPSC